MADILYSLYNVSFAYNEHKVLNNISLEIFSGDFIAIIGKNGSGKTTFVNLCSGLTAPSEGNIYFKDSDIKEYSKKELHKNISFCPQSFDTTFPFTVSEIVQSGRYIYRKGLGIEAEEDKRICQKALEMTELKDLVDVPFTNLSHGEKQRTLIASVIAQDTEVLVLDEPISSLDIEYQIKIMDILEYLNEEEGKTIIIVLHDLNIVLHYANETILFGNKTIASKGRTERVLRSDIIKNEFGVDCGIIKVDDQYMFVYKFY